MADFTALKTAIQNAIKQNGNEEITGNLLQEVLLAIVTTLGDGSINDLITALGSEATTRGNADTTLQQNIDAEATTRSQADTALGGRIDGVIDSINAINAAIENGYVYAGIATPSSTPTTGKVFYLALTAGTYTNYGGLEVSQGINILKNNGSAWSLDSFLGIDDAPTPSSNNLIKSGGAFDFVMKNGSAFDLTAYNNGTTYADLNAALTALNALPAAYKRGGMSFRFVLTSDNKYIQARCMAQNFTTDVTQWQGVDDEPTDRSMNLVESGGVKASLNQIMAEVSGVQLPIYAHGAYIDTNVSVGSVVSISLTESSSYNCYVQSCSYGDWIVVNGIGGLSPQLWAFLDVDNKLISKSGETTIQTGTIVYAPQNAAKVIINERTGASEYYFKKNNLDTRISNNAKAIGELSHIIGYSEIYNSIPQLATKVLIPYTVLVGGIFEFKFSNATYGTSYVTWGTADGDGNIIERFGTINPITEETIIRSVASNSAVNLFVYVGGANCDVRIATIAIQDTSNLQEEFDALNEDVNGVLEDVPVSYEVEQGCCLLENGNVNTGYANWSVTEHISVRNGDIVTLTADMYAQSPFVGIQVYNKKLQILSNLNPASGEYELTINEDGFIRVCYKSSDGASLSIINKTVVGGLYSPVKDIEHSIGMIFDKVVNFVGMSIWWYDGRTLASGVGGGVVARGYQTLLGEQFGFKAKRNYCYSGFSLGATGVNDTSSIALNKINELVGTGGDVWTIDTITNDFKRNIPIGTISDYNDNTGAETFYGALRIIADRIKAQSGPTAIVIVSNGCRRNNSGYTSTSTNANGNTMLDFEYAIAQIAMLNDWYYVDQYRCELTDEIVMLATIDGLHLNNFGYRLAVKPWIEQFNIIARTI